MSRIRRITPNVFVHYNKLEKDIKRLVYSFNYPLNIFLTSKYEVKNNHIYATGPKYHIFAFCLMLSLNALCFFRIFVAEEKNKTQQKYDIFSIPTIINFVTYIIGFNTMFLLDYMHKNNNISLILVIQTIYRTIDFSKSIGSFIFWNWISTIRIIFVHIFLNIVYYRTLTSFDIGLIIDDICDVMCMPFDLNFVIAIRFIILLKNYLDKWIEDLVTMSKGNFNNDEYLKMFEIYGKILKAYCLYNEIFQVLVSSKL